MPYRLFSSLTRWNHIFIMVNKIKRTLTSILPVSDKRKGRCISCGECCKLPLPCPLLKEKHNGAFCCSVYAIRTLNCRKYPRAESEFLTKKHAATDLYKEVKEPPVGKSGTQIASDDFAGVGTLPQESYRALELLYNQI